MTEIQAQTIMVQGRPCRTWAGGAVAGPPLLLLHGGLGDAISHWHHNFADLGRDFRLLAPDLPGFGHTAPLPQPSYLGYAAWVAAFCDAVGDREDTIVVGNSLGGAVARVFAAQYPARVARVALVDGGRPFVVGGPARALLAVPPLRAGISALLGALATTPAALRRYVHTPALLTPTLQRQIRRGIRNYIRVQARMLREPPVPPTALLVTCPVLIVWGAQDGLGSPALGRALAEALSAQALAVIDGAGHMPMFEQPEEFGRVLRRFVFGAT